MTSVIKAWDDSSVNVKSTTDEILQCLSVPDTFSANVVLSRGRFHPDFQSHSSQIQREMLDGLRVWLQTLGNKQSEILARLSKQAVRDHQNVRLGAEGGVTPSQGSFATNPGSQTQANMSGYLQGIPGMAQAQGLYHQFGGGAGGRRSGMEPGATGASIGAVPGTETVPPGVPFSLGVGVSSQSYGSYASGPAPLPQGHTSRPPHYPGPRYGPTYGYDSPAQPGFGATPDQSSYLLPSSSFTDPGLPSQYPGGPPLGSSGSPYPGSFYPGQSSYPGQHGAEYLRMPDPGNSNSVYNQPPLRPPGRPGTGTGFPDSQHGSNYESGSYGGYGHGSYQPEY